MKTTQLLAALALITSASHAIAKSELEALRSLCAEQERQIHQLETENSQIRDDPQTAVRPKPQVNLRAASQTQTIATTTATKSNTSQTAGSVYIVKAGDSIDKIARKVGMTADKLLKANGLKPDSIIQPGQKLNTSGPVTATPIATAPVPAPVPVKKTVAATPPPSPNGKNHTVQAGETFYSISKKYRIDTALLIAANPSVSPSALRPGQVLSLISKEAPTPAPLPEPTPVETPVVENEAIDPPPVSQPSPPSEVVETVNTVTIDDEMTYAEFAAKHGTTVEKLNANNGFDLVGSTILAKGSQIYVTEKN